MEVLRLPSYMGKHVQVENWLKRGRKEKKMYHRISGLIMIFMKPNIENVFLQDIATMIPFM